MIRCGELTIRLDDFDDDDYNQTLELTKEIRGEDDLLTAEEGISLMINFLHTMTYSNYTIIEALRDGADNLIDEAKAITSGEGQYEPFNYSGEKRYEVLD